MKPKKVNDSYIVNASSNIRVLNKMMTWDIPLMKLKRSMVPFLKILDIFQKKEPISDSVIMSLEFLTKENAVEKLR